MNQAAPFITGLMNKQSLPSYLLGYTMYAFWLPGNSQLSKKQGLKDDQKVESIMW